MSWHRELKRNHETAVIDNFVDWLNRTSGSNWEVIDRPNPPDAIITDGGATFWVEHADLYRHWEEARSETSLLNPNKKHIPHSENPIYEPDRRTAMAFMTLLQDKLSSCSYRAAYEKYGQGFLIISERDPLFDKSTIAEINRITQEMKIVGDKGYFGKVYIAMRAQGGIVYGEVTYLNG
jgi:hypothetical protein